jgi:DNA mismatch repair protein MutS
MAGAVRFTTPELASFEKDISSAADKSLALELEFFETISLETLALAEIISQQAAALAAIDVASAQANLAIAQNYTRPVVDSSLAFHIEGGRHPVVEAALRSGSETFFPNDCDLSDSQRIWLLTGPNMAGKSTFLRQNALIVIMAQAGFFVPAISAHIGMVDKVFSRVGAADDLARGRSTFMIEMVETATILNQSTSRSLVILDEIGRGTSTFDGLSIAWACLEYLHNISKCRGLFATHYHELTTLQETLPHLSCAKMEVREWKGDVIFLHSVPKGPLTDLTGFMWRNSRDFHPQLQIAPVIFCPCWKRESVQVLWLILPMTCPFLAPHPTYPNRLGLPKSKNIFEKSIRIASPHEKH